MKRLVMVGVLFASLFSVARADAYDTGCLRPPLPATPIPPIYSRELSFLDSILHIDVWREPCPAGGSIVLARLTPITPKPIVCPLSLHLIQGDRTFVFLLSDELTPLSFCDRLSDARTFYVAPNVTPYAPDEAFTLVIVGQSLEVPAGGLSTASPFVVLVVSTGCNPCRSDQVVAFDMNITNLGPEMTAELRGGVRFPDGNILPLVNQMTTLPTGSSVLPLVPAQNLPGGLPTIDLLIEAAILEPTLGVTLSRHNVTLHLLP